MWDAYKNCHLFLEGTFFLIWWDNPSQFMVLLYTGVLEEPIHRTNQGTLYHEFIHSIFLLFLLNVNYNWGIYLRGGMNFEYVVAVIDK